MDEIWKNAERFIPSGPPLPGAAPNVNTDAQDTPVVPPAEQVAPSTAAPLVINIDENIITWSQLDEGLELLQLGVTRKNGGGLSISAPLSPADIIVLRVDPELYEFTLHMASEDGEHRTLAEHASRHGLSAAINAGMYLQDNLTNTGYMQNSTHINNPRIVTRFGVFFVAEPHMDSLPKARLLEKNELGEKPEKFLNHYTIVAQNFRLISTEGEVLWPDTQSIHSISALAQDKNNNILLMLCRYQFSPAEFSRLLMALPLDCASAMYLEGGSPAGLLLKSPSGGEPLVWRGKRNSILPLDGPADATLPNVLGIRPRPKESAPHDD